MAHNLPTDLSRQSMTEVGASVRLMGFRAGMSAPRSARLENMSCSACHEAGKPRTGESAMACTACHGRDMGLTHEETAAFKPLAHGYVNALHGLCIRCHKEQESAVMGAPLSECRTCHRQGGNRPAREPSFIASAPALTP